MPLQGWLHPSADVVLRVSTFRVADAAQTELRTLTEPWGRARWVGRRLVDHPDGAEVVVVSLWDGRAAMEQEIAASQARLSDGLRAAVAGMTTQLYTCRAYGYWERPEQPCLLRIFRGGLVTGDPKAFDAHAATEYLANFERNSRCVSIAAGISPTAGVMLATLWTNWDAVVSATGGDIRQVLPVTLAGFELAGSAVHYEVLAAENR